MQGDQWKSELARLINQEMQRVGAESTQSKVVREMKSLTTTPLRLQDQGSVPAQITAKAPTVTKATSKSFRSGTSLVNSLVRLAAPSPEAGLGLSRLVTSLAGLFASSNSQTPTGDSVFSLPAPLAYQGSTNGPSSSAGEVRYNGAGLPERAASPTSGPAPINVTVHAMDSKSFLDHSDAIASAVRKAMLESHSLNSVVMDL